MELKQLLTILQLASLLSFAYSKDYQKCTEGTPLASQMRAYDSDVAYNENLNEYLIVFISQVDAPYPETSVFAQRYDAFGVPVGPLITLITNEEYPYMKRFPRVVFNSAVS